MKRTKEVELEELIAFNGQLDLAIEVLETYRNRYGKAHTELRLEAPETDDSGLSGYYTLYGTRPMTPEEIVAEDAETARAAENKRLETEKQERTEYARLRRKHEPLTNPPGRKMLVWETIEVGASIIERKRARGSALTSFIISHVFPVWVMSQWPAEATPAFIRAATFEEMAREAEYMDIEIWKAKHPETK